MADSTGAKTQVSARWGCSWQTRWGCCVQHCVFMRSGSPAADKLRTSHPHLVHPYCMCVCLLQFLCVRTYIQHSLPSLPLHFTCHPSLVPFPHQVVSLLSSAIVLLTLLALGFLLKDLPLVSVHTMNIITN